MFGIEGVGFRVVLGAPGFELYCFEAGVLQGLGP